MLYRYSMEEVEVLNVVMFITSYKFVFSKVQLGGLYFKKIIVRNSFYGTNRKPITALHINFE